MTRKDYSVKFHLTTFLVTIVHIRGFDTTELNGDGYHCDVDDSYCKVSGNDGRLRHSPVTSVLYQFTVD